MKTIHWESIKKTALYSGIALLLCATYATSMTSCGKGSVALDSMNKAEDYYYTSDSAAGNNDYFGDYELEMPVKDDAYPESAPNASTSGIPNDLAARKLIKNANLTVETKNFDEFMAKLEANIASMGGYLSSSSVNGNSFQSTKVRYANLTVRIPTDTYDAFVSGIGGYGNVTYKNESVSDVTMAYVDTESRIKAYEAEYETLLEILAKAESLDDVLIIQNRITEVTYQLESYRSQLRKYDDLVSYCTVQLSINEVVELTEVKEQPKTVLQRMSRGISDTWEGITDFAEDFAVGFVSFLPILGIWAVIALLCVVIVKSAMKKSKKKNAPVSPADHTNKENESK